jgi:hypothetical protein
MFCSKCGSRLNGGGNFCHLCGEKVKLPEASPATIPGSYAPSRESLPAEVYSVPVIPDVHVPAAPEISTPIIPEPAPISSIINDVKIEKSDVEYSEVKEQVEKPEIAEQFTSDDVYPNAENQAEQNKAPQLILKTDEKEAAPPPEKQFFGKPAFVFCLVVISFLSVSCGVFAALYIRTL